MKSVGFILMDGRSHAPYVVVDDNKSGNSDCSDGNRDDDRNDADDADDNYQ